MKRLHELFQKYIEESENLKEAEESLPADLKLAMEKDLTKYYSMQSEVLFAELSRENGRAKTLEELRNDILVPTDKKRFFLKRLFCRRKTIPNYAKSELEEQCAAEADIFFEVERNRWRKNLEQIGSKEQSSDVQTASNAGEQEKPDTVGEQSDGAGTADKPEAPAQSGERGNPPTSSDVQTVSNAGEQEKPDTVGEQTDGAGTADKPEAPAQGGERESPTEKPRRTRQRLKPTCQPPKLIEIETPLGRQIKLDIENGDNNG